MVSTPQRRRVGLGLVLAGALTSLPGHGLQTRAASHDESERTEPVAQAPGTEAGSAAEVQAARLVPAHPVSAAHRAEAERMYLQGAGELARAKYPDAGRHFAQAYFLDPSHAEYLQALSLVQEHRITSLLQQAATTRPLHPEQADRILAEARALDGDNPRILQHMPARTLPAQTLPAQTLPAAAARHVHFPAAEPHVVLAGSLQVSATSDAHSFHFAADERSMAQTIAAAYGVRVAVDPDLKGKPLRVDVDDVKYPEAMRIFGMLSGSFATVLDEHSVLLADDNAANRLKLERLQEEVIPLPGYSVEQINDVANLCKSVFDLKQVSVQPQLASVTVRAPEDTLQAVNIVLADLLDTSSEVVIDLKLYSIDTEKVRNVGVVLPQSLTAFNVLTAAKQLVNANSALVQQLISSGAISSTATTTQIALALLLSGLATGTGSLTNLFFVFGGGLTQTGLSLGNFPTINLLLRNSDARTLDDVQLRVGDRQSATFKSGTRYPIQTSLFSDVTTQATSASSSISALIAQYLGTSSLASSATIPQVQYEDLGLTVKATPHVQRTGEVALHLEIKVEALSGTALNGIPVLASRQFSSDLTIRDGQTALMSSNVTQSESRAVTGLPGLSEIPGFQIPTNKESDKVTGNLVLLITPHIVHQAHMDAKGPLLPINPRPDTE